MTKSLQLARLFKKAGYRVVLSETRKYRWAGPRFSRAVDDFVLIPDPKEGQEIYTAGLVEKVRQAGADFFIPVASPVASVYDAFSRKELEKYCRVIHWEMDEVQVLDDKFQFCSKARDYGLNAPKVYQVKSREEVENFEFSAHENPFILKSIRYDSIERLDLRKLPHEGLSERLGGLEISDERPWVLQEFIEGDEYCTHGTVVDGALTLYCCCQSSPFQVNYQHIEVPEIRRWVETFVGQFGGTGQASFDFIKTKEGEVFPIECNPRTHSAITTFYKNSAVAPAFLERPDRTQTPQKENRPTYWLAHETWRLLRNPVAYGKTFRKRLLEEKEAVWDPDDPLPFFCLHHLHIPSLLLQAAWKGRAWKRIDFNIGKLVEEGGD